MLWVLGVGCLELRVERVEVDCSAQAERDLRCWS